MRAKGKKRKGDFFSVANLVAEPEIGLAAGRLIVVVCVSSVGFSGKIVLGTFELDIDDSAVSVLGGRETAAFGAAAIKACALDGGIVAAGTTCGVVVGTGEGGGVGFGSTMSGMAVKKHGLAIQASICHNRATNPPLFSSD